MLGGGFASAIKYLDKTRAYDLLVIIDIYLTQILFSTSQILIEFVANLAQSAYFSKAGSAAYLTIKLLTETRSILYLRMATEEKANAFVEHLQGLPWKEIQLGLMARYAALPALRKYADWAKLATNSIRIWLVLNRI